MAEVEGQQEGRHAPPQQCHSTELPHYRALRVPAASPPAIGDCTQVSPCRAAWQQMVSQLSSLRALQQVKAAAVSAGCDGQLQLIVAHKLRAPELPVQAPAPVCIPCACISCSPSRSARLSQTAGAPFRHWHTLCQVMHTYCLVPVGTSTCCAAWCAKT